MGVMGKSGNKNKSDRSSNGATLEDIARNEKYDNDEYEEELIMKARGVDVSDEYNESDTENENEIESETEKKDSKKGNKSKKPNKNIKEHQETEVIEDTSDDESSKNDNETTKKTNNSNDDSSNNSDSSNDKKGKISKKNDDLVSKYISGFKELNLTIDDQNKFRDILNYICEEYVNESVVDKRSDFYKYIHESVKELPTNFNDIIKIISKLQHNITLGIQFLYIQALDNYTRLTFIHNICNVLSKNSIIKQYTKINYIGSGNIDTKICPYKYTTVEFGNIAVLELSDCESENFLIRSLNISVIILDFIFQHIQDYAEKSGFDNNVKETIVKKLMIKIFNLGELKRWINDNNFEGDNCTELTRKTKKSKNTTVRRITKTYSKKDIEIEHAENKKSKEIFKNGGTYLSLNDYTINHDDEDDE